MDHKEFLHAVIFDLDGVIVSTDDFHYLSWKRLAEQEGIYFNREINERLRGVSRMESLEIILEKSSKKYSQEEKLNFTTKKNEYYIELINRQLTPAHILPGVMGILAGLKRENIGIAVGSSSRNTPLILERIGLADYFDVVVDGNNITNSKPDPEVFLLAAKGLGVPAENCLVVEDADSGVEAALAGGMNVLGVGFAHKNKSATYNVEDLTKVTVEEIITMIARV